uniref:Uncharacterized protein n=1 Tax=Cucumis melo TaxID=3656 RepID=A0A9I9E6G9_CUCME
MVAASTDGGRLSPKISMERREAGAGGSHVISKKKKMRVGGG